MFRSVFLFAAAVASFAPLKAQDRIDVLVVYTPAVEEFFSGANGVEAQLLATFAATNEAFANSGVDAVANLVGPERVEYVEAALLDTDLDRLQGTNDGFMDEVHALRNAYGADHVALMRRGSGDDAAGLAFILTSTNGRPDFAFSVFNDVSGLSNFVFAHELGHNLGLAHEIDQDGQDGIQSFARGWRFNGNGGSYRTIMAINSGFTRIPHYSNPNVNFDGASTGNATSGDSARGLELSAPVVEGYRAAQPAAPEFFVQPTDITIVRGQPAIFTSGVNGLPPLSLQWFAGTTGDPTNPLNDAQASSLELANVNTSATYWLQASNADGTQQSRTARVQVIDAPAGPFSVIADVLDQSVGSGFPIDRTHFQEVRFSGGYVDSIEMEFFKQGSPADAVVRIVEADGSIVFSGFLPASQVSRFGTTIVISVEAFVRKDVLHRVEIEPIDATQVTDGNELFWQAAQTDGSNGLISSLEDFFTGRQFGLLARGRDAETFTAWQAQETIADSANGGFDDLADQLGVPYGVIYATGQGLDDFDRSALPQIIVDGDDLVIRFQVLADTVDVEAILQDSDSLTGFSASTASLTPVQNNDPAVDAFEIRFPLASLSSGDAARFFRVLYDY